MALRESIVQVVHHVHAFTQLPFAQEVTIVAAIAIITTKASSAQKVSAQVCRTMLHSAHRVAIVHAATMARVVTSSVRVVRASAHREVMAVLSRVVMVVHSRVATVVLSRVAMASLTAQLLTRRVHVSAQPITIQMQSTQ